MTLIVRLTLVCCLVLAPVLAWAEEDVKTVTRPITPIEAARLTISLRQYAAAEQILDAILKETPDSTDALFLKAESRSEQGKFADAIPYYRKILAAHPELIRVRLDLARAEFETGDDEGSDYNFRLALAYERLPETVVDNIGHYLAAIQSRKTFTYSVNLSVAPDSNMNAAAASRNITLFGLPFELAQNSVQKSGIGVTSTLAGEYFTPLATNLRLRTGGLFYSVLFPGHSQFDDVQARATIGPQWFFNGADASLLAVVGKRWYGGAPYNESVGGRAEGDYSLTRQLQLSSYLEGLSVSYHTQKFYNGYTLDQGNFLTYYFNPRMLVRLIVGLGYQSATTDAYEDWYWHLGFGVQFEFPWGITTYAQPDVRIGYWSGVDPLFGVRRLDRTYGGKISAYKRDWELFGFSPVLSLTYTNNRSNIPIYKYHRIQAQIGVTRQF